MFTLLGRVFAVVAAVLLIITVVLAVREQRFRAASVTATGTVTEVVAVGTRCDDEDEDGTSSELGARDCQTVFAPRVRFPTADGGTRTFLSGTASWPPEYAVGDTVAVRYRPSDPGSARVDQGGVGIDVVVLGILTAAFGGFAVLWAVLGRRTRSWSDEPDAASPGGDDADFPRPPWVPGPGEERRPDLR